MKFSHVALAALPGVMACTSNNCARDIQASRSKDIPLETRTADCSRYMTTYVYISPTATATPPVVYNRKMRREPMEKRDPVTVVGTVPAYATQCSNAAAYASACSCWGFTPTVITVATPTTTVTLPAPTCFRGLEWGFYGETVGTGKGQIPHNDDPYGNYRTTFNVDNSIKGLTPSVKGVSSSISYGATNGNCDGHPVVDGTTLGDYDEAFGALVHRGYFIPDVAGSYTVTVAGDDLAAVWIRNLAKGGWTIGNANANAEYLSAAGSYTFTAAAGEYVPIRILYVNAQGCEAFSCDITRADGTSAIGPSSFVTGCTGVAAAPAYPAWNTES